MLPEELISRMVSTHSHLSTATGKTYCLSHIYKIDPTTGRPLNDLGGSRSRIQGRKSNARCPAVPGLRRQARYRNAGCRCAMRTHIQYTYIVHFWGVIYLNTCWGPHPFSAECVLHVTCPHLSCCCNANDCTQGDGKSCVFECERLVNPELPIPTKCDLNQCSNLTLSKLKLHFLCPDGSVCAAE